MTCPHGIYGDGWGCQQCNPAPPVDGPTPVLPRSSSDPLNSTKTAKAETCDCGCIRTYSSKSCLACGVTYDSIAVSREQGAANSTQSGVCPACGSNVHYETKKKSKWECSDCGEIYAVPVRDRK